MGRKNIACLMRRSRPPGSGCSAKAALASLFSLRCCSLAWRRRRSLRARSRCQAILDQQPCSRRDHRASPSIRGRTSTDAARGGISCSIVRRRFQALCRYFRVPFPDTCPAQPSRKGPPLQREYATGFLPTGVRQSLCRVSNLRGPLGPRSRGLHAVNIALGGPEVESH